MRNELIGLIKAMVREAASCSTVIEYAKKVKYSDLQCFNIGKRSGLICSAKLIGHALKCVSTCTWSEDQDGNWETACGDSHVLWMGTPDENKMKFCCYCGKKLVQTRYSLLEECDLCHEQIPIGESVIQNNNQILCRQCAK